MIKRQEFLTKKAFKIILCILLACFAGGVGLWFVKAEIPGNPFSTAAHFRFENYLSHKDMMEAMRRMFPEGTHKDRVDEILITRAGARADKLPRDFEAYSYYYVVPHYYDATWNIVFKYYDNHTVDQIWVNGSAVHRYKPFTPGKIQ